MVARRLDADDRRRIRDTVRDLAQAFRDLAPDNPARLSFEEFARSVRAGHFPLVVRAYLVSAVFGDQATAMMLTALIAIGFANVIDELLGELDKGPT